MGSDQILSCMENSIAVLQDSMNPWACFHNDTALIPVSCSLRLMLVLLSLTLSLFLCSKCTESTHVEPKAPVHDATDITFKASKALDPRLALEMEEYVTLLHITAHNSS